MKVLFVSSEVFPLIKTGGLADVSGSLPAALQKLGVDVRLLIPGYPAVLNQLNQLQHVAFLDHLPTIGRAELLLGQLPHSNIPVITIKAPSLFEREGGPYANSHGQEWQDNPARFAVLSKVAAILGSAHTPLTWHPHIVHCNDWQTGLTPAYLTLTEPHPKQGKTRSVMSLHNMAFQGCYPSHWVEPLGLPRNHFSIEGFEYHHQLSFLKAGIFYADTITTVSPRYAKEIQTPTFGFGLEGLLTKRGDDIKGILNGIDPNEWNPEIDPHLIKNYTANRISGKKQVKKALQQQLGLSVDSQTPLLGVVSRLTHQKGLDMLLSNLDSLLDMGCQLALLGSGDSALENAFQTTASQQADKVSVTIGYNEGLAHQIMAGSDMFIMPSRFEPCGLNQLYGLAYGTPPIVNATGGLADSIIDNTPAHIKNNTANGFVMTEPSAEGLLSCITRAVNTFKSEEKTWRQLQKNGMSQDLSWNKSALEYLQVYQETLRSV